MSRSTLPRRLAALGIAVTFALAGVWWFINTHNLFAGVSSFLEDVTFVLCPPEFPLGFIAMDMSARGQLVAWIIAAGMNGALYYWLGRGIVALRERFRRDGGLKIQD